MKLKYQNSVIFPVEPPSSSVAGSKPPFRTDHRFPIDQQPGRMEDKRVILWLAVLLRPYDVGKRDQGIVADDKGKNDTFIAL